LLPFHFTFCFGSDVLIVGLAFTINIPSRNPHAGMEETGVLRRTDDSKDRVYCQSFATEMSDRICYEGPILRLSQFSKALIFSL
jgi:hypothetical protein